MKMQKILTLLSATLLISIAVVGSVGAAHAQDRQDYPPFLDVPRGHRAYRYLEQLETIQIPMGFQPRTGGVSRLYTRYEFAVGTARLLDRLPNLDDSTLTPSVLHALRSLSEEFAPELKKLGVPLSGVLEKLANRAPFPNVPETHWAASSVERLRKAGILIGSPDGNF